MIEHPNTHTPGEGAPALLGDALAYAAARTEWRDHGHPGKEVAHLLGVAALVLEQGGDQDEAVAALLHHTAGGNRSGADLTEIERWFGSRICTLVKECAAAPAAGTGLDSAAEELRREAYLKHIYTARRVTRILLACEVQRARALLRACRALGPSLRDLSSEFEPGRSGYHRDLVAAFREVGAEEFTVEELDRLLREIEAWAGGADQVRVFCYPSRVGSILARCIFDGSQVRAEEWTSIGWEVTQTPIADVLAAPRATWAELAEIGVPEADW